MSLHNNWAPKAAELYRPACTDPNVSVCGLYEAPAQVPSDAQTCGGGVPDHVDVVGLHWRRGPGSIRQRRYWHAVTITTTPGEASGVTPSNARVTNTNPSPPGHHGAFRQPGAVRPGAARTPEIPGHDS